MTYRKERLQECYDLIAEYQSRIEAYRRELWRKSEMSPEETENSIKQLEAVIAKYKPLIEVLEDGSEQPGV